MDSSLTESLPTTIRWRCLLVALLLIGFSDSARAQVPVNWLQAVDGNWFDATKWSGGVVPNNGGGTTYEVTLDADATNYTITIDNDVTLDLLDLAEPEVTIRHESGTVTAGAIEMLRGAYELRGGTIQNTLIGSPFGNGRLTALGSTQSTLDNVSVDRTIFVGNGSTSGNLRILNGLDLTNTRGDFWLQGHAGTAVLEGGGTITGVRSGNQRSDVVFDADNFRTATLRSSGGTLTIGTDVLVRAVGRGQNTLGDENELLVNQGTIQVTNSIIALTVTGNQWRNEGLINQTGGGTINLDGTFRTADLGDWVSESARVQILGQLDNTGAILDFTKDGTTGIGGAMTLKSGTITGGIIMAPSASDPFRTNPASSSTGFLDGVTLDGFTEVSIGNVVVTNGLHLQNTLTGNSSVSLSSSFTGTPPKLTFDGTQSITGTGEISFNSLETGEIRITNSSGPATLTLESGITVTTDLRNGIVGSLGQNLTNRGSMLSKRSAGVGRSLSIEANEFRNEGLMSVTTDSTIDVNASSFVNTGTLGVYGGVFTSNTAIENSGLIEGLATLDADVINDGVIAPGFSPGLLTVDNLTQTALGKLEMEIGGLVRGSDFDAIDITNHLSLAGTIEVDLINSFDPGEGNSFDLLDWNTASFGSYSFDFSGAVLSSGLAWDTSNFEVDGSISVVAAAVPEPSTFFACALAACGVVYQRRRGAKQRGRSA